MPFFNNKTQPFLQSCRGKKKALHWIFFALHSLTRNCLCATCKNFFQFVMLLPTPEKNLTWTLIYFFFFSPFMHLVTLLCGEKWPLVQRINLFAHNKKLLWHTKHPLLEKWKHFFFYIFLPNLSTVYPYIFFLYFLKNVSTVYCLLSTHIFFYIF